MWFFPFRDAEVLNHHVWLFGRDGSVSLEANFLPQGPTSLLLWSLWSCSCWYCAGSSGCRVAFVGFSLHLFFVLPGGKNMICGHPHNHVHHQQQSIVTECHWLGNFGWTHFWNAKRNYFMVTINVLQLYSSWTGWWANNWWWNLASLGCWKSYPAGSCAGLPLICCNFVGAFLHGLWVGKEMIHFLLPDTKWNSSLLRPRPRESRAWVWVDQGKRSPTKTVCFCAQRLRCFFFDYPFDCKFDRHFEVVTSLRCREVLQIASNCYNWTPRVMWWG